MQTYRDNRDLHPRAERPWEGEALLQIHQSPPELRGMDRSKCLTNIYLEHIPQI